MNQFDSGRYWDRYYEPQGRDLWLLSVVRHVANKKWYISAANQTPEPDVGPYETRAEAVQSAELFMMLEEVPVSLKEYMR